MLQWKIKHTHTHVPGGMEDNFKDDDDLFLKTATSPGMERGRDDGTQQWP